jgi:hypothetical protein
LEPENPLLSFRLVGVQENEPTKTTLGVDYGIIWSASDAVTLFASAGAPGSAFQVESVQDDGRKAVFTGLTPASSNDYYYALYPADDEARLVATSGTLQASLPTVQTGVENSFAAEAALSMARVNASAVENTGILHFKNVGAILSFLVPGNYINVSSTNYNQLISN